MNTLSKLRVDCRYDYQYQTAQKLIQAGFIPNWNYSNELVYTYIVSSFDTNIYPTAGDRENCFSSLCDNLSNIADIRELNTVPLMYNAPAQIITTENTVEKIVEQTTTIHENNFTYIYTFITTYDLISGNITTANSSYIYNSSNGETAETIITPNPDGTTTSYTTVENPNGTTTTSQQDYNEDGIITHDQTNITNPDGSSESHITNFNDEGNPTDGENIWIDNIGNNNTQSLEYDENGDSYVTQYTIDTSQNTSGSGEQISSGLDTGMIAFDGRDFDAVLKFAIKSAGMATAVSTGGTGHVNPVISMTSRQTGKLNGTLIYFYNRNDLQGYKSVYNMAASNPSSSLVSNGVPLVMGSWKNGSLQSANKPFLPMGKTWTNSGYALGLASNSSTYYTFTLVLHCVDNVITSELYDASGNTKIGEACDSTPGVHNLAYADFSDTMFDSITVEIGMYPYNTVPNYYYQEVIVHDFDIVKH